MKTVSILNHVLGPVMRGPSSSHTAGAYHIASMARSMAGGAPRRVLIAFDPAGSYARTYAPQGADRAFAMGFLGRPLTDASFFSALEDAPRSGLDLRFDIRPLRKADHPNAMEVDVAGAGTAPLSLEAKSIGGGEVEISSVDGWPVSFTGAAFEILADVDPASLPAVVSALSADGRLLGDAAVVRRNERAAVVARRSASALPLIGHLCGRSAAGVSVRESSPVYFIQTGRPLFAGAVDALRLTEGRALSLGRLALESEARLLGLSQADVTAEILRRYDIMAVAAESGLDPDFDGMQLLRASAGAVFRAHEGRRLSTHGPYMRAAARALAVMHVNSAMGVVCAAPTGGAAGVLPGTVITLAEERRLSREQIGLALLAAGAVGAITAQRATFAAEVAGCQVEIGAAGAMAAAAVVEAMGGSARQAFDAAAIAYQNTMGSVCDLVQGVVEIPCHTRNAVAAANAFICADLILGGYTNPIPLDETIDAVYAAGRMLPSELRCTAKGGLALAPSALGLKPRGPAGGKD
jgi:L-serine dehydratase